MSDYVSLPRLRFDWNDCFPVCGVACRVKADIVFAVDGAWCLSIDDFKMELDAVRSTILGLSDTETRVGMLVYSNQSNVTFNLGDFASSPNKRLSILKSVATLYRFGWLSEFFLLKYINSLKRYCYLCAFRAILIKVPFG